MGFGLLDVHRPPSARLKEDYPFNKQGRRSRYHFISKGGSFSVTCSSELPDQALGNESRHSVSSQGQTLGSWPEMSHNL